MYGKSSRIQGTRYKETNDKERQWSIIQIKSDRSIHFSFYQEIMLHGRLGYVTPSKYDEELSQRGSRKEVIERVSLLKNENRLFVPQKHWIGPIM